MCKILGGVDANVLIQHVCCSFTKPTAHRWLQTQAQWKKKERRRREQVFNGRSDCAKMIIQKYYLYSGILIDLLRSSTTDSRVLWCCYSKYLLTAEGELYLLLNSALRHLFHWPPTCFIFWCFIISYFVLLFFSSSCMLPSSLNFICCSSCSTCSTDFFADTFPNCVLFSFFSVAQKQ